MTAEYEDSWYEDANTIVNLARGFYTWAPFRAPDTIGILKGLIDTVILPGEPDWEPDNDFYEYSPAPYWTIERMFEDL
jgi:hypothetical protein